VGINTILNEIINPMLSDWITKSGKSWITTLTCSSKYLKINFNLKILNLYE
jgi:hypothetical protein